MDKIIVVEPQWTEQKHSSFNSAFLKVLQIIYPDKEINFYAEKSHLKQVKELSKEEKTVFKPIKLIVPNKLYKIPFLYFFSVFQTIRFLLKQKKGTDLFFTSISPFALFITKALTSLLGKKVVIVLHGEIAYLDNVNYNQLNKHYKLLARAFQVSIKTCIKSSNINFIVLGELIKKKLDDFFPGENFGGKVLCINHPYLFETEPTFKKDNNAGKLHLATVGLATRLKKSDRIIELHDCLIKAQQLENFELTIIGKVADFKEQLVGKEIAYHAKGFLGQQEYDRQIDKQDYLLFFYPESVYKYTASGAFLDAVLHNKPIIALTNSYFEYYQNQVGQIGVLCTDMHQLCNVVINLGSSINYGLYKQNMRKLRSLFEVENVALTLKPQLAKIS